MAFYSVSHTCTSDWDIDSGHVIFQETFDATGQFQDIHSVLDRSTCQMSIEATGDWIQAAHASATGLTDDCGEPIGFILVLIVPRTHTITHWIHKVFAGRDPFTATPSLCICTVRFKIPVRYIIRSNQCFDAEG